MKQALISALMLLLAVSNADADFVKCKLPNGSLYVGPTPPPDCVGSSPVSANAPGRTITDTSILTVESATSRRREIEQELSDYGQRLEGMQKIDNSGFGFQLDRAARPLSGVAGIMGTLGDEVRSMAAKDRRETLFKARALYQEWDSLKARVAASNGGDLPPWWRPTLSCGQCPSRENVAAELAVGE